MGYSVAACRNRNAPPSGISLASLIAYFKLSDTADSFGSNTLTNSGVTFAAGLLGNCGVFDGGSSMSRADNAALSMDTSQDFTVDGWFQLAATGSNRMLVSKGGGGSAGSYEYTVRIGTTELINVDVSNGTSDRTVTASGFGAVSIDTWYYFALRHDAVNDLVKLRVNTTDTQSAWTGGCWDSTEAFYLGERGGAFRHSGKIDDVSVWKRCLTDAELLWRYNSGAGNQIL